MKFWQIASGDGNVDLLEIFLKVKIALIGPGTHGDYFDNITNYRKLPDGKIIKWFCEDVKIGDIFILKHVVNPHQPPTWEIKAVGKVLSPYRHEPIFRDCDFSGWDMQHCRRIDWKTPSTQLIVQGGGAPIRFQRIEVNNPLVTASKKAFPGLF